MTKTGAIIIPEFGGPDVLEWREVPLEDPGPDDVLIRHSAVGLNFIDIYHRTGLYPVERPFIPGLEGAGVVETVGQDVKELKPGDRVAYPAGPLGAYSESRIMPANRVTKIPDAIDDQTAAGMMLKGCTVEYLIRRTYAVQAGDWVLWHAAAGGVGLLACQWLRALGARIIGIAGSAEKTALAKEAGCDHTIIYGQGDFVARVREITEGRGVDVVYDSLGKDSFSRSLDCLKPRGTMVTFGNATGPVDPVPPALLNQKGALFLTRPSLAFYYADKEDFKSGTAALFEVVQSGKVKVYVNQLFPLRKAADAQRALEARKTTGSTVLLVDETAR